MLLNAALVLLAVAAPAQVPKEPAKDLFLHFLKAPGFEARFVDYHWQPVLFAAMEKGDTSVPLANRNWVIARLTVDDRPFRIQGKLMGVGTYALTLWPNVDGKGMGIEVRQVDMREVFPNLNALAPAPRGETIYKGLAPFEALSPLASRFDASLAEHDGTLELTIRYGDRRLPLQFVR
jgi:hypothetical protein